MKPGYFAVLVLAVAVGGFSGFQYQLWKIPYAAMENAETAVAGKAGGYNRMLHPPRPTASTGTVVRPSPDQLYSACVFDLSSGPVEIAGAATQGSYWSLSFFAHNTDNFFVINDREIKQSTYRFLLAEEGDESFEDTGFDRVIRSPSTTGIVLQRVFIDSEARFEKLDQQRSSAVCHPLAGA
jgi:uncharacterized membrane protein